MQCDEQIAVEPLIAGRVFLEKMPDASCDYILELVVGQRSFRGRMAYMIAWGSRLFGAKVMHHEFHDIERATKNGVMEREIFRRFDVVEPRYSRDYLSSSLFQQLGKLLETLS